MGLLVACTRDLSKNVIKTTEWPYRGVAKAVKKIPLAVNYCVFEFLMNASYCDLVCCNWMDNTRKNRKAAPKIQSESERV